MYLSRSWILSSHPCFQQLEILFLKTRRNQLIFYTPRLIHMYPNQYIITYSWYPALLSAVVYINKHRGRFPTKSLILHSHESKPEMDWTNLSNAQDSNNYCGISLLNVSSKSYSQQTISHEGRIKWIHWWRTSWFWERSFDYWSRLHSVGCHSKIAVIQE